MQRKLLIFASFGMAIAIILGAMGAHALAPHLTDGQMQSFQTGVRYQVWHCLAIIGLQLFPESLLGNKVKYRISYCFLLGIILFSFSIYLLSLRSVLGIESAAAILGPITPLGGMLTIGGWLWLTAALIRHKSVNNTL